MYGIVDGCNVNQDGPSFYRDVFLFGEEGIPLQANRVINRFVNFPDDQLLIWLLHHENRELVRIDGVVLPLYGDWSFNFWHWCTEVLPMSLIAHEGGFSGTYLVPAAPFAAESLILLGISPGRIRIADRSDYHLECMCLFPKSAGNDEAKTASKAKVASLLSAAFARENRDYNLYISRNGNAENMRKVVNEERLLEILRRYDFITIRPEELTLAEQLAYTCNAGALVGPHGAGMTHCAFMPERSLVIEFFAPTYINPCVLLPCTLLGHRYYQITSLCLHGGYPHDQDIEVPMQMLEMTLKRELGRG